MLILLQHNSAHLGIATGLCLSESATKHLPPVISRFSLATAMLAAVSTALAEILGGAIAIKMLTGLPLKIGAVMVALFVGWMLFSNSYKKIERWIIGFVSLIGLSFIFELSLVNAEWAQAAKGWLTPSFPDGSMFVIMSILGAVVMPHNLFLHSEVIQSRQWNLENDETIKKQLKDEFMDTLLSMIIGWAINSAMMILAAVTFFSRKTSVTELEQAQALLSPFVGPAAAIVFALALLFAGVASSVTAGMAGGSIFAGIFKEPYDIKDIHTKWGVGITIVLALAVVFFIQDTFRGLLVSQMLLSVQLPITIFLQIYMTSSGRIMGKYKNSVLGNILLWGTGLIVTALNIALLVSVLK